MFDTLHMTLVLGQADAPPAPPGGEPGVPGTPGAEAPITGQPGDGDAVPPGGAPQSPFGGIWFFIIILVIMWVVLFLPQRRREKQKREMLGALKKNDKIVTRGGIMGTVIDVRENDVLVKVDEGSNTKIKFSRHAIESILSDGKPGE